MPEVPDGILWVVRRLQANKDGMKSVCLMVTVAPGVKKEIAKMGMALVASALGRTKCS